MPEVFNKTPLVVQVIPLITQEGHNVAVVVAKITFDIDPQGQLRLSNLQEPILLVDEFADYKGSQFIRVSADLTDFKPATDIIVVAPKNIEARKTLEGRVIGVKVGFLHISKKVEKNKWPFGPLRRDEEPRKSTAGSYGEDWVQNRMPLLPTDFNPLHNLAAPPDQVIAGYLKGDEVVVLTNLYGSSDIVFQLPGRAIVVSGNVLNRYFTGVAALDTLLIWSDKPRLVMVWRYSIPTRQKIAEVSNVYIYLARIRTTRELYGKP